MRKVTLVLILLCVSGACSSLRQGTEPAANLPPANSTNSLPGSGVGQSNTASPATNNIEEAIAVTKKDCENVDTGDNALLKSQTFPINFEPFKNSCFVTSYNPEYDDPPMESEIAIYKNSKRIFDFPGQFNGVTTGCWVDAVSFSDLNSDGLTDIIIVGKCSAKTAPYNENVLYVNTGKAFVTTEAANYELADFKKASEITDFVKKNPKLFFK